MRTYWRPLGLTAAMFVASLITVLPQTAVAQSTSNQFCYANNQAFSVGTWLRQDSEQMLCVSNGVRAEWRERPGDYVQSCIFNNTYYGIGSIIADPTAKVTIECRRDGQWQRVE